MSEPSSPITASRVTLSLWKHANFRKLWIGQTISLFGTALTRLALPFMAVTILQASSAQMGLLAAIDTLPALLFGLAAGVWIDRYRRRTFLIAGDIGRAVLIASIPVATWLGILSMPQLYIVGFLVGILALFFDVAAQSYLPVVLDAHQLIEGNGKLALSRSITAVAGPSLAGIVIQIVTAPMAIALDAISYLASAICIVFIRQPEEAPQISQNPILAQVREGLAQVFGNRFLRAFAGCMATSNFAASMFFALYILFGTRELGLNAAQLGLVYGIGASGAMFGALLAPIAAARIGVGWAIAVGAFLGSLEIIPVIFATPEWAVPLLMASSFIGNFGWVLYSVNESSLRQAVTPISFQGRMNATFSFLVSGMLPLGALLGRFLGDMIGLRQTIVLAAIGSLFAFLWILFSPVRKLKRIHDAVQTV